MTSGTRWRLPSGRAFTACFAVSLLAGLGAAYSNCFGIDFQFDDAHTIVGNSSIRSLRNIPSFFVDPTTFTLLRENLDVRPLLEVTYAVNYQISGLSPWSYHLFNLLLHLVASLLVFAIVRDHLWSPAGAPTGSAGGVGAGAPTGSAGGVGEASGVAGMPSELPAALAALFFALAPLGSEMVEYISSRSAVLTTTLYLGAFYAYLRGRPLAMAVLHGLALLTKPIAITLPGVILLHDLLYRDPSRVSTLSLYVRDARRWLKLLVLPIGIDLCYLLYRRLIVPHDLGTYGMGTVSDSWTWFMSQWPALLYYVRLFVWPDALCVDPVFPYAKGLLEPRVWLSLVALCAWIATAALLARRARVFTFATFWYFITLSVESTVLPLGQVINDHRPYIGSSLGLSLLLVWLLARATAFLRAGARIALVALGAVILVAAIPVIRHRNWVWQDSLRLWLDTTEKSPSNGRAWMNAGVVAMSRGDYRSTRRYFEIARKLNPNYPYVFSNISILESHDGNLDAALDAARTAVRLAPEIASSHFYLGRVLQLSCRIEEALAEYQVAQASSPRDARTLEALAKLKERDKATVRELMTAGLDARFKAGDPDRAVRCFQTVRAWAPAHYGATFQLASALDLAGRGDEARPLWSQVLDMAAANQDAATGEVARKRLAQADVVDPERIMKAGLDAFWKHKDPGRAAEIFRLVVAHDPRHYGGNFQLARTLDELGRHREAVPYWKVALSVAEEIHDVATTAAARRALAEEP